MRFTPRALAGCAFSVLLGTSPAILFAGCEARGTTAADERSTAPYDDATVVEALSLGARGEAVTKLQDYLMQYGYFPNAALASQFPGWAPVIDKLPEAGVFDPTTEAAVRALQARNGLEATGIADPATRAVMAMGRCGNPDSFQADPDSKFAIYPYKWKASKHSFTWKVLEPSTCVKWNAASARWVPCFDASHPAPATRNQVRSAANDVIGQWAKESDLTFTEKKVDETADIIFKFAEFTNRMDHLNQAIKTGPGALGITSDTYNTKTLEIVSAVINFNQETAFSPAFTTPAGNFDLTAVALHEFGHALGFDHSSTASGTTPTMKPSIAPGPGEIRKLAADDIAVVSSRYDLWNSRSGTALDMGIGADGSVWRISTTKFADGYRIHKWNPANSTWTEASGGGGASKITVGPDGTPWVATNNGSVWFHSPDVNAGGWTNVGGICAKDLSIGANGSLWFVTCTPDTDGPEGGYKVGKFVVIAISPDTAAYGVQEAVGATHALRIAVAPEGTPWIVNSYSTIYFRISQDPAVDGWGYRGGTYTSDIAISPDYYAYAIGQDGKPIIRNDQEEVSHMDGTNKVIDVPARHEWYHLASQSSSVGATFIAAGRRSIWVNNANHNLYESTAK